MKPLPEYRSDVMSDIGTVGTKHLCLQVDSIEEIVEDLKAKGVNVVSDIDSAAFGGKFVFIKDCNGILIELYEE